MIKKLIIQFFCGFECRVRLCPSQKTFQTKENSMFEQKYTKRQQIWKIYCWMNNKRVIKPQKVESNKIKFKWACKVRYSIRLSMNNKLIFWCKYWYLSKPPDYSPPGSFSPRKFNPRFIHTRIIHLNFSPPDHSPPALFPTEYSPEQHLGL